MEKLSLLASKPLVIILTLLFTLSTVACGDTASQDPPQPTETPEQTAPPPEPNPEPEPEEPDEDSLVQSGVITYGSNVKEVTTQVSEASVDVGIVYQTDAFSAGLDILDFATPEMCGQVIYPAAVLANSPNIEESQSFLDFLFTPEAIAVFENVGFSAIN